MKIGLFKLSNKLPIFTNAVIYIDLHCLFWHHVELSSVKSFSASCAICFISTVLETNSLNGVDVYPYALKNNLTLGPNIYICTLTTHCACQLFSTVDLIVNAIIRIQIGLHVLLYLCNLTNNHTTPHFDHHAALVNELINKIPDITCFISLYDCAVVHVAHE